jgi:hydrogenase small subunit
MPADPLKIAAAAAVAGAAVGVAVSFANRAKKASAKSAHETTTLADLEK